MRRFAVLFLIGLVATAGIKTLKTGLVIPEPYLVTNSAPNRSTTTMLIDAAGEKAGLVLRAPKTGNIRKVGFGLYTVTTGATVDVRIETVDLSSGYPTGTLWGTDTNGSQAILDTDDNKWFTTTLTADAVVTRGDLIAVVIVNPETSYGNMVIPIFADELQQFPYTAWYQSSWSKSSGPILALEYSDGTYESIPGIWPMKAINAVTFNSGSATKLRGLRFKLPFPARITGVEFHTVAAAAADFTVQLYGSDGSTVLGSVAHDGDLNSNAGSYPSRLLFDSPVEVLKDTYYRIVIKPTTVTNVTIYDYDVETAAIMDAAPGGQNFHYTGANTATPTGESDWTNTLTKRPFLNIIIDGLHDGTGGNCESVCISPD
jgi:hypothetical protein